MKQIFYITILFLQTACVQQRSTNNLNESAATPYSSELPDTTRNKAKLSFGKIAQIVSDTSASIWVNKQGETFSLALHFQYKDTLAVSYSPECWLMYPYKADSTKIVMYWDNNIDTKYDFDIVKAVNKADEKYIGKPFMILELENDTTLKATYLQEELVRKINSSNSKRTFFPGAFHLVQEDEMYD